MSKTPIDVSSQGAVVLGDQVVCDGFIYGMPYRVQTHIHEDHMSGFDSSKGFQEILASEATKELLIAYYNADLRYRSNLHVVQLGSVYEADGVAIEMLSSGHMVGSAQVAVKTSKGERLGYSGDFSWPLEEVIEVDALVVDSTYGSPDYRRTYSQEEARNKFIELVLDKIKTGPISIKAHPGTLQHALELLDGALTCPILASAKGVLEAEIYRRFGYSIGTMFTIDSAEGQSIVSGGRYIRIYGRGDNLPADPGGNTVIILSAYMTSPNDPLIEFSERSYRIAISSHADFDGTLEYIRATGAREVLTDNSRGGHAVELANVLKSRLNIQAWPSAQVANRGWGL